VKRVEASNHGNAVSIVAISQMSSDSADYNRNKPDSALDARELLETGSRMGRPTNAVANKEPL
jgi:hypothetical protein